jgi:GDP-L-fucose synthase
MNLAGLRMVVTGGAGFLGTAVVAAARARGADVFVPRSRDYNLVEIEGVRRLYADARPDVIIHLAAQVGGIGANQKHPGKFFYENLMMGVQLFEVGRQVGIKKIVAAGTICAYPKFAPIPFREDDLWNGYPEETNAPYGLAKKMLLVQAQAYRAEYGTNFVVVFPVNLYGPRDNFDLETSHVIPALIRKIDAAQKAGRDTVELWGDGTPTREFLYVDDAAEGLLAAAERYDGDLPINLGSGQEISIRDLATKIAAQMGWQGKFVFDANRPNGQPRRALDVSRAASLLDWRAKTSFDEGLSKTISWWRQQ